MVADKQKQRMFNIPPRNKIDMFLDNTYPDEYMDKIYNNKKEILIDEL